MVEDDSSSNVLEKEFELIISLIGINFVFLGFLLDIPEGTKTYNQTLQIIPYFYKTQLNEAIFSSIFLSFIFLIFSLYLYFLTINGKYNFKSYRVVLYIGIYYWINLFIFIIFLLNIKYDLKYLDPYYYPILLLAVGYPILFYHIFKVFFPFFSKDKTNWYNTVLLGLYFCFYYIWIHLLNNYPTSIFSPFYYQWLPLTIILSLYVISDYFANKIIPFIKLLRLSVCQSKKEV